MRQHAAIDALAATLPAVVKAASGPTQKQLEDRLRAWADGSEDPNALLQGVASKLFRVRVVISPLQGAEPPKGSKWPLFSRFELRLPAVDKAVPQVTDTGAVTQLSLEADVEVVAERAQRIEIWLQGAGCLPTISIEPAFFRLVGRLLVYWDTSNVRRSPERLRVRRNSLLPCAPRARRAC